ncbi:MAG: MarC family protein [Candidatus Omnitrophota bacterium]
MYSDILKSFFISFVPLFLAVDIVGTVPIYLGLTESLALKEKKKILGDSILLAGAFAIIFALLGKLVFTSLGITINDFKIAGGILLVILSVYLLMPGKSREFLTMSMYEDIGVFPLATPLITGPAVLATTMMLLDSCGLIPTLISLMLNMGIAWLVLRYSDLLNKVIGGSGIKALSKISYIFLAAIGIMILRQGITGVVCILHNPLTT